MLVVAHISDPHFDGSRQARSRAQAVIDYINTRADGIDALLVTGDIADAGAAEQYLEAAAVLRTSVPMLMCPGNHDVRAEFAQHLLGASTGDQPINASLVVGGALILSCDSSIPHGRPDGLIEDDTLAWADKHITEFGSAGPVVMAFHHPPVTLEMPFMDSIRLHDTAGLSMLLDKHPNIVGLFCGHAHTGAVTQFHDRRVAIAPGISSTLNLPFDGPEMLNDTQPPGLALHVVNDDWRIITHYRAVQVKNRRWIE